MKMTPRQSRVIKILESGGFIEGKWIYERANSRTPFDRTNRKFVSSLEKAKVIRLSAPGHYVYAAPEKVMAI